MKKTAIISNDKQYRYELRRIFDDAKPIVCFVGLNPSKADAEQDDPTILKCIAYTKNWGYGGFIMVNLFAYRATNPKDLYSITDPIGRDNDKYLQNAFDEAEKVICCWGKSGNLNGKNAEVLKVINKPYCLAKVKNGNPSSPIVQKSRFKTNPT